jgi:hypothetical protein
MKLLNEASIDDQFNTQMNKIQLAIMKLEKLALGFGDGGVKPVKSQQSALADAASDLKKIEAMMFNL